MEELLREFLTKYSWAIFILFIILLIKNALGNLISGIIFMMGKDFNVDDIVYIHGKKARIVRQTPFKTIFYIMGTNRKMIISNKKLYFLDIEKLMRENGDQENISKDHKSKLQDYSSKDKDNK